MVKDAVENLVKIFAPGGGFVLTSVHNIQNDVPVENIETMTETTLSAGKY